MSQPRLCCAGVEGLVVNDVAAAVAAVASREAACRQRGRPLLLK
jgi:hypothetical protein